jgi:hypothetical protein
MILAAVLHRTAAFLLCAKYGHDVGGTVLSVVETEATRNCVSVIERGKQAWSEAMGRRTDEAMPSWVSMQEGASPDDQGLRRRKCGGRILKGRVLTWEDLTLHPEG